MRCANSIRSRDCSPHSADPYYDIGDVYVKMKRLPDAITAYRRAVALSPNDPDIQGGLASRCNPPAA